VDGSLLASVFIFLAAASLLVPLSKLSGLGSVIGYLVAGVIIGPGVLKLISDPETILHFSEFGVVMMLFLIGLELKPSSLWDMRRKLLGRGGLQVGLTTAAVTLVAVLLGRPIYEALTIGMALSLSSTAIALQIMGERKMTLSPEGRSGFAVLLFQDVIVIAMIAVLPLLATLAPDMPSLHEASGHGGGDHGSSDHAAMARPQGLWLACAIVAVFGGMIIAGRVLLRPVFRLIARSKVRETFTAMALLLVVGAALLMNWLGLSAALGAFIAGVVLADSEFRHQLERDIEPFKALLLGLFFMSVGMSLDLSIIANYPLQIVGAVVGLLALKFLVLFAVGSIFKIDLRERYLFSLLLCQAGEFGFVLFQFAVTEGLMSAAQVSPLNTIIALSMALTPLLIIVFDRVIAPRFSVPKKTGDAPQNEGASVLILGFGRVGQVASRLLKTQEFSITVIDHDGDHIEFVKQFGHRVFYGDVSDVDLLHVAGADTASVIIIAIDDVDKTTETAHAIKEHFPQAKIVARARNRTHMFALLGANVDFAERETIRGALAMGRKTLEMLGVSPARAQHISDGFLAYDFKLVQESLEIQNDMDALSDKAKSAERFLRETLGADNLRDGEVPDRSSD
jgi:monovalent cation:proton antiporter-2 (CPA2) family protein